MCDFKAGDWLDWTITSRDAANYICYVRQIVIKGGLPYVEAEFHEAKYFPDNIRIGEPRYGVHTFIATQFRKSIHNLSKEEIVISKIKKLWNSSNYVKQRPETAMQ